MGKKPLVSIILLVYRNFDGIWETLDSIFEQSYECLELIISDDSSPEFYKYEVKLRGYIEEHKNENIKFVRIQHLPINIGTTKNCNKAIAMAQGKYIKFISPYDSFHECRVIEKCVDYCEKNDSKILVGQTYVMRRDGYGSEKDKVINSPIYRFKARNGRRAILTPTDKDIEKLQRMSKEKRNRLLATQPIISTISVFFSKELLDKTNGFIEESRLIEDMTYWPMLACNGYEFHFSKIVMYDYRLNGVSNGGALKGEFKEDHKRIINEVYIENEYRWGFLNNWLKSIRRKEEEWFAEDCSKFSLAYKAYFIDMFVYCLFRKVKYLFLGTKL